MGTSEDQYLFVEPTNKDFAYWLRRPYISAELRSRLSEVNVLLVPQEEFRGKVGPVFPVGTEEVLEYLRESGQQKITTDICISDQDYKEIALHSAWHDLADFVVKDVFAGVVVDLVADYLRKKWLSSRDDSKVKFRMTVVYGQGRQVCLSYEGPSSSFQSTVQQALSSSKSDVSETPSLLGSSKIKKLRNRQP